jgi:hypothetical protein
MRTKNPGCPVKEQLEAAARKHNELLTVVIGAGRIFLEEHARQTFRPVALAPFPHPQNAVLKPLLQRPVGETDAWLATQWHVLYPPRIAPIADLALMVGRLWHERRATEPAEEITVPELEPIEEPAPAFAEADAYGRSRPDARWQCLMRPADAAAAVRLLLLAMTPGVTPAKSAEYGDLLQRYTSDAAFRDLAKAVARGAELQICGESARHGLMLISHPGGFFAPTLDSFRCNMSFRERVALRAAPFHPRGLHLPERGEPQRG